MASESLPTAVFHHYLPIDDTLLRSGFYVTSVGRSIVPPGAPYPPATHPSLYDFRWEDGRVLPEFSLMIVTRGGGVFESRGTGRLALAPGSAIFLLPGIWHRYRPDPQTGWEEKWMHFNGEFAHRLLEQGQLCASTPMSHPGDFASVELAMDRLLDGAHRDPAFNSLGISLLGLGVLSSAVPAHPLPRRPKPPRRGEDPAADAVVDYIWTRGHAALAVSDVAEHVGMSRRTLERRFREVTGRSVLDEIVQCRFSRAERLLRETDLPLKAIVSLAGFGSMQNMRFTFQKRTGLTPSAYRVARFNQ